MVVIDYRDIISAMIQVYYHEIFKNIISFDGTENVFMLNAAP